MVRAKLGLLEVLEYLNEPGLGPMGTCYSFGVGFERILMLITYINVIVALKMASYNFHMNCV